MNGDRDGTEAAADAPTGDSRAAELQLQAAAAPTAAMVSIPETWTVRSSPVAAGGQPVGQPLPCPALQRPAAPGMGRLPGSPHFCRVGATGGLNGAHATTPTSRCSTPESGAHTHSAFGSIVSSGFNPGGSPLEGTLHSPPGVFSAVEQQIPAPVSFLPAPEAPQEIPILESRPEAAAQPGMALRASSLGDHPGPGELQGVGDHPLGGAGSRWSDEDLSATAHVEDPSLEADSGALTRAQLAHTANEVSVELYGSAPSALESSHDWGGRASGEAPVLQPPSGMGARRSSRTNISDFLAEAYTSPGDWLPPSSLPEAVLTPASGGIGAMGALSGPPAAEAAPSSSIQGFRAPGLPLPPGSPYFNAQSRASAEGARGAALAVDEAAQSRNAAQQGAGNQGVGQQALPSGAQLMSPGESVSGESSTPMAASNMVRHQCRNMF
jgi:hypothetical protein